MPAIENHTDPTDTITAARIERIVRIRTGRECRVMIGRRGERYCARAFTMYSEAQRDVWTHRMYDRTTDGDSEAETLANLEKLARDDTSYYARVCRDNAATLRAAATAASTKAEECDRGAEAMERALAEIGSSDDVAA
jgi:hypothetical protein